MNAIELIQTYYQQFNQKNYDGMIRLVSENIAHGINEGGIEVGRDAFKTFLCTMDQHYDEQAVNIEIFTGGNSGRMAAEFIINGTYKATAPGLPVAKGQTYSLPVGAFFCIEDHLITRVTNYYNLQDWIHQVSR